MMTLTQITSIFSGGPGSGCHGPNCGRPITAKNYQRMVQKLKNIGVRVKRGTSPWDVVKTYDAWFRGAKTRATVKKEAQRIAKKAKLKIQRAIQKGKLPKIGKTTPGIVKTKGREHIDVQPTPKSQVKKQYTMDDGTKMTVIKTQKEYETRPENENWLRKPDLYKGRYILDKPLFQKTTLGDKNEKNSWFIHNEAPGKSRSIEIHRQLGDSKHVTITQRELGQYDAIANHREVTFNNIGRAAGWLNKKYGITFKLK